MEHDAPHFKIRIDDEEFDRELLLITLCNGPREGGGFFIAPEACPDDGWLDYAMVDYVSRAMMFRLLPEFLRGTHARFDQVRLGRFQEMELSADRALIIHADGEIFANYSSNVRKLKVGILPGALELIV
jgi:diacylglycerol kinase (ATP)